MNDNYDEKMEEFDQYLAENMAFIKAITPTDPTISEDDEWRTDDYSYYDKMR